MIFDCAAGRRAHRRIFVAPRGIGVDHREAAERSRAELDGLRFLERRALPDGRAKIVDFGIARLADQSTRLTKTDAVLGTFHYIAPERLMGAPSDGRADIWSVGVMLYEMIAGGERTVIHNEVYRFIRI